jgi:hypothetical protein
VFRGFFLSAGGSEIEAGSHLPSSLDLLYVAVHHADAQPAVSEDSRHLSLRKGLAGSPNRVAKG